MAAIVSRARTDPAVRNSTTSPHPKPTAATAAGHRPAKMQINPTQPPATVTVCSSITAWRWPKPTSINR